MNQTANKIIAVTGATGAQGGGVIRAILAHPEGGFSARAITRNPDSDQAKALVALGVEVVKADLDDEASLARAFAGAYGAFCITNFWEHFSPDKEIEQAGNLARAAKSAGVSHVIWSTLEDVRDFVPLEDDRMPTIMDHYKVPHFDAKGEANHLFTDAGVPTTFLNTAFYWDNLIYFGMGPKPGEDGTLAITFPLGDAKLAGIAGGDIGGCAYGVFAAGNEFIGKTVGIAGGHLSGQEMADSLSKALGREVRYNAVSPDVYRSFGFPAAEELGNMFQFNAEFSDQYCAARNIDATRKLNPDLQSFDKWLEENASKIPLD
ncbi:MAG TPA: NmrA/HSCARG family protein [Acidimicrobiales bacterium]|nr:NmrA/HSCARG family protein [Acidimicrobiales bacterium]